MSICGGIGHETICPQDCQYFEKSKNDASICTWNPFDEYCTCFEAQSDRNGGKQ
jgi:hypothetical protein